MSLLDAGLRGICFFCGEHINQNATKEHIFPQNLLKRFSLKEENFSGQNFNLIQYSRCKVNAHRECNNECGSVYEQKILKIIESFINERERIKEFHLSPDDLLPYNENASIYRPSEDDRAILSTWLIKLYYGIIWYEAMQPGPSFFLSKLQEPSFKLMQKSYQHGYGFNMPSSVYCLECNSEVPFDWGMMVAWDIFWIKIGKLLFMININDGNLLDLETEFLCKQPWNAAHHPFGFIYPLSEFVTASRLIKERHPPKYILDDSNEWLANESLLTLSKLSEKRKRFEEGWDTLWQQTLDILSEHYFGS